MKLLPQPHHLEMHDGFFSLNYDTKISLLHHDQKVLLKTAQQLQKELQLLLGYRQSIISTLNDDKSNTIYLQLADLNDEEYTLTIDNEKVTIRGGSQKAVFYGVQTLIQIVINGKTKLPALEIKDEPYFKHRGFYHDITRGEIPTLETLKKIVDIAAFYKINQLQLYVEHSFAFDHFSEIWSDVDPITAEEILIIDEYCKEKHIELVPSLSTFGHLYRILSTKSYEHLCELDNSSEKDFSFIDRQLNHTLDVSNPESIQFVKEMIDQFVPLFTSNQFNICADETFDLGKGKTKALAEEHGVGKLYVDFLNQIIDLVKAHGKTVMVWSDIIVKHPEYIAEIPEDVIFLHWDYSGKPNEKNIQVFTDVKRPFYLCSGIWGWNHLAPAIRLAHSNIFHMAQYGVKHQAMGILNTNWGDFGHINFLSGSMPGLIQGAAYSWNPHVDHDLDEINQKASFIHYLDEKAKLIPQLTALSDRQLLTFGSLVRFLERGDRLNESITNEQIIKANEEIKTIKDNFMRYLHLVPSDKQIDVEEMLVSANGIELMNVLIPILYRYELNQSVELIVEPEVLAVQFERWFMDYVRLWRRRNRESELHRLKDYFIFLCRRLRGYVSND